MWNGASEDRRPIAVALIRAVAVAPLLLPVMAATQESSQVATPDPAVTAEDSALIGNALMFDPANIAGNTTVKPLRRSAPSNAKDGFDVSRTDGAAGASTVILKKPLATEWNANVGADLGLAGNTSNDFNPDNPLRVTRNDAGSAAAWASVDVPHLATIDARLDPSNDRGRIGTTFKQSIPLGGRFSMTLQNSYALTEALGQPQTTPSDVPLMTVPTTTPSEPVPEVWSSEKLAKFNILSSGTTLAAGLSSNSTDPVTHNTLSAEQKLYGPLNLTTAVTDVGQSSENKSVSARFKLNW